MKSLIQLLRPYQWVKNAFVFLPLFFGRHMLDIDFVIPSVVAFAAFCLSASGIYCLNDVIDADKDRQHPRKCHRPVASGAVSKSAGLVLALLLEFAAFALAGLTLVASQAMDLSVVLGFYLALNILYCIRLKHVAIIDIFIVATGFVLRIFAGGTATGIVLSHWIVLVTFLLALLLKLAKTRDDVVIYQETGVMLRQSVARYNLSFVNQTIGILASVLIVCYIMYTVSDEVVERVGSPYLYVTSVFVLAGVIRYLQLTMVDGRSGSPTRVLLHDHFIHLCILGWGLVFFFLLYC